MRIVGLIYFTKICLKIIIKINNFIFNRYYHSKEKFAHMLGFLSNEIVSISKEIVGENMLDDPYSVRIYLYKI
jgi:hypothetical protein